MSVLPNSGYRWRRLTPDQHEAVCTAVKAGVSIDALAREYRVSSRTIYRAIARASAAAFTVHVGDWRATFEMTQEEGPMQVTPWVPA